MLITIPALRSPNPNPPHPEITQEMVVWLAQGNRGLSSEAIFTHLSGLRIRTKPFDQDIKSDHPSDSSDFRRCVEFLNACPTLRPHLHYMATVSPVWAALVRGWDTFEAWLYHNEGPRVTNAIQQIINSNQGQST